MNDYVQNFSLLTRPFELSLQSCVSIHSIAFIHEIMKAGDEIMKAGDVMV